MTRCFVTISFLTLLWSSTALAQEPTGFAGFAWGTPRVVVSDELTKERCPWRTAYTTLQGHQRIACTNYQISAVGPVYLTLDFVGEVFTGYGVTVPRQLGSALRAAIPDIVAAPARAVPGMSRGTWKTSVNISESQVLAVLGLLHGHGVSGAHLLLEWDRRSRKHHGSGFDTSQSREGSGAGFADHRHAICST